MDNLASSLQMLSQHNAWLFLYKYLPNQRSFSAKKQVSLQPRVKPSIFMIFTWFAQAKRDAWQQGTAAAGSSGRGSHGVGPWGAVGDRGQGKRHPGRLSCICYQPDHMHMVLGRDLCAMDDTC